ncbi:MAG: NrtA/SsuA/CpmA family ABC transporter substrate-binding protein [Alphaproteobacteria bacterium]|nr:NrtA/SsuA/CpmA family ABC transporter substrate-binding protein [Alphaproteobacteria bacterium]
MIGALVAVALAIGGFFALRFSQDGGDVATVEALRLGAYEGDVGALEWIAKDKGFFQKVGLDVTLVGFPSGNAAVNAMRAGQVEVATAADLVVAKRSFDEPDLRILADICRYWNKGLIGRKDRGVATPADLKGKRIGVPATSSAEHNLVVFLALQGLSTDQVTMVDLPPAKLVEAMAAGTIDAALVWEPHVMAIKRQLGDNAVTLMDGGTEAHLLLVATEGWLATRGGVARKLLRAMIMAEDWVAQNRDEAKAYLTRRFALDPDHVEVLWPRMQLAVGLPQEILAAMDSEARWLAKSGNQTGTPDFSETVHTAALRAVKPSAVHVFTK